MITTRVITSYPWDDNLKEAYTCTLDEETMEVARKELREDQHGRKQALYLFREWLKKNPDVRNCRTDNSFLLRFLRVKKFSIPMAQQMLVKYLNLRQTFSHLFMKLDFLEPSVNQLIDNGYVFASPIRDSKGRRVVLAFAKNFDPYKYTRVDMAKVHNITYETLLEDEETQIMGFTHFGDLKGVSAAHITLWTPTEFNTLIKWGEQSVPMRNKEMHLINCPSALLYVYDFAKNRFSNKMRSRFNVYSNLEECQKNLDPKVLPKEYGGDIPMAEMIDMWKTELALKREHLLSLDRMELLDNSSISMRSDKKNPKNKLNVNQMVGSFKKLEVD